MHRQSIKLYLHEHLAVTKKGFATPRSLLPTPSLFVKNGMVFTFLLYVFTLLRMSKNVGSQSKQQ